MRSHSGTSSFGWFGTALGATLSVGLLDQQVITPLIAAMASGLGVSVPEVGLAISAYAVAASLTALVIGPLSDSQGRRRFLLAAAGVLGGAAAVVSLTTDYRLFLLARGAAGMAGGTIAALAVAWVADLVPYQRRGRVMAVLMGGAMGVAVLAQVAAAFAAGFWGHGAVYAGLAVFAALCALMLLTLPERAPARRARGSLRRKLPGYLDFLRSPIHRTAALAALAMSGSLVGVSAYASGWLQEARGFPIERIGVLYGAFGAAIMAAQPVAGPLADRFGKRRFALFTSFAVVGLTLLLPVLSGALLLGALLAFGALAVARIAAFAALRSELAPPARRAAFLAFSGAFSQLGIAAATALGGLLYPYGFSAVCWAMAGFGGLAALLIARVPEPGVAPPPL